MADVQIIVKGKNLEVTPALRQYAEKKVGKLLRFFDRVPTIANVTMSTERERHVVEITMQVGGLLVRGESTTGDMYASVDDAVEKVERQIGKYKTRILRRLRQEAAKIGQSGEAAFLPEPAAGAGAEDDNGFAGGKVVRYKHIPIKPMSLEEATMQMELLGHDFYVFANAETEEINVVYRRRDGNYGLLEPER